MTKLLVVIALFVAACSADVSTVASTQSSGGENPLFDRTGVAPIADAEAAAQVDQDSPAFKSWLDSAYGASLLGDERVGATLEKLIQNRPCNNNQVGDVTTSTSLGKGAAMCAAAMSTSGFYACSGTFTAGTCSLAFGSGVSTYSASSCASHSGTVPYPGTVVTVSDANRCFMNYSTFTGYVHAGLRSIGNIPAYVYEVPSGHYNAKVDFTVESQGIMYWGF